MDIVFNVNPLGLEGLGATLTSLIRNCSNPKELKFWFFCSGFRRNDRNNIIKLLDAEGFDGDLEFIEFNAKAIFGHLKSLHGDWTAYGRLLISDYVESDTALYLDADLIILLDILSLRNYNFAGAILAAVYGSTIDFVLDKHFFIHKLKWSPTTGYFNSGVVLFNLKKWRDDKVEVKWKSIAEKYANDLISHDQTLLNALCEGKFAHLPPTFNNGWWPGKNKPLNADNSIIHFAGSPKPWDLFGRLIHSGYETWHIYSTSSWNKAYGEITAAKVQRTWNIRRSILRHLKINLYNELITPLG